MPSLTLYHASPSRSSVVLWMLEEWGQPYDVKLISLSKGAPVQAQFAACPLLRK
jgi:glutathione S-transferase